MTTDWVKTVKKTFKQGRLSNPAYQFKDALKDAKKYYKKGEVAVVDAAKKTKKAMRKTGKKIRSRFAKRSSKHRGKHGKSRKHRKMKGGETRAECEARCERNHSMDDGFVMEGCKRQC